MTPTQSQLNAWQPGVLADAGAGLNARAQNLSADARKMFNSVHAMGGNGAWRGVAQASAETAVEAQTVAARKVVTLLEGTSDILGAGAREMRGRRDYLHSLLEAASGLVEDHFDTTRCVRHWFTGTLCDTALLLQLPGASARAGFGRRTPTHP